MESKYVIRNLLSTISLNITKLSIKLNELYEYINREISLDEESKYLTKQWLEIKYGSDNKNLEIINLVNRENNKFNYYLIDALNSIEFNEIIPSVARVFLKLANLDYIIYENHVIPVDELDFELISGYLDKEFLYNKYKIPKYIDNTELFDNKNLRIHEISKIEDKEETKIDEINIDKQDSDLSEDDKEFLDSMKGLIDLGIWNGGKNGK